MLTKRQSCWPRGLRRVSADAGVAGSIRPGTWLSIFCECCVLSGRGLCIGLITRAEESYRVCVCVCVWVCVFVIECGQGPQQSLHLQWVGRQRSKLRKEEDTTQRGNFTVSIYRQLRSVCLSLFLSVCLPVCLCLSFHLSTCSYSRTAADTCIKLDVRKFF